MDTAAFREVMGRFATGLTVVTGLDDTEPVGFTCQSFVSVSLDPPYVAVAPARRSTTWPRIARSGRFCVNVLSDSQQDLAERFAASGGSKFEGVSWTPAPATGSPLLAGSLAWVDCSVELIHDAGDHELILGRVLDLATGEGRPLVYYGSAFATLATEPEVSGGRPAPPGPAEGSQHA
jgi:flavin reductase (DIM6/NTAB) family NADH-FMN oxidoreductase RutF